MNGHTRVTEHEVLLSIVRIALYSELTIGMATSDDVLYLMKFLETGHIVFAKQTRVHGDGGRDHVVSEHAFPEQSFATCRSVQASGARLAYRTSAH